MTAQATGPVRIHPVPPGLLPELWPLAEPMLAPAVARAAPLWEIADMPAAIRRRVFDLWLVSDDGRPRAAALARIERYPRIAVLDVPFVGALPAGATGGTALRDWLPPLHAALSAWGRENGATVMRGGGRRGWCRLLGFRPWQMVFLKEIAA